MKSLGDNLLTVLVLFVLGVLAYVIVVGGVICVLEKGYAFNDYLEDLSALQPILIAAVFGAVGREILPLLGRKNGRN